MVRTVRTESLVIGSHGDGYAFATLYGTPLSFASLAEATEWAHSVGRGVTICMGDDDDSAPTFPRMPGEWR